MPHTCSYSFFYLFLLQKKPCLRGWNHSSMSLFWNAIVLTGDQAQSYKSRYQVAKNARPCILRDSRGRNLLYPAWLRVAKNARCCVQQCVVVRQESTLIEHELLFLKCCFSSDWIWTLTKVHWWDWWWELDIHGSHCEMVKNYVYIRIVLYYCNLVEWIPMKYSRLFLL